MPRFPVLFLTASLSFTAPVALAQDTAQVPQEPAAQETAPLPEMVRIEEAWRQGDFVFVREGLKRLAEERGGALAQMRYGRMLLEGRGGAQDIDGAVMWLDRAVAQNHAEAAALLAKILLSEFDTDAKITTTRDPVRAAELYTFAATQGFAEAQYQLARLYGAGLGVERDDRAVFNWLLAAANQQHAKAQVALAQAYFQGLGVTADAATAFDWLRRAAGNGSTHAQMSLARAYEQGNGVAQSAAEAAGWYRQAAEAGVPLAQRALGMAHLQGNGVAQDVKAGMNLLLQAARGEDAGAMYNLGAIFAAGVLVPKDLPTAAEWFNRASEYGLGRGKVAFGDMLRLGQGIEADFNRALKLYRAALETPDAALAQRRLGELASAGVLDGQMAPQRMVPWVMAAAQAGTTEATGWLVKQADAGLRDAQVALAQLLMGEAATRAKGIAWLEQAATGGDADAQLALGRLHMTGDGVAQDYVAAHGWFNIAATYGVEDAAALRETAAALMTPEEIAAAQSRARDWFEQSEPQPPATPQQIIESPAAQEGTRP